MVGLAATSRDPSNPVAVEFTDVTITKQQPEPPVQGPCAAHCQNPTAFTFSNNYQSGDLGTAAVCLETTHPINGGNCGNLASGRQFFLNGVQKVCNFQNWWTVPQPENGGYCVEVTPGDYAWAYFTVFE